MNSKKIGVIGATGYAGAELVRLLLNHPFAQIAAVSSKSYAGQTLEEIYPNFTDLFEPLLTDAETVVEKSEVVFASLPHGLSEPIAKACVAQGKLLIDLGADFRLYDEADYQKWYGLTYQDKALHQQAVYCIPELHRDRLAGKRIIGNPGCYPTSIALGLAPALSAGCVEPDSIVIDSKSGTTGAGRVLAQNTHFPDCNENFAPYKIAQHRHTPEIEQTLSDLSGAPVTVTFVPHLLPINRGILSSIYVRLKAGQTPASVRELYESFYRDEPFVRLLKDGAVASVKAVRLSNYCDLSLHFDTRTNRLIVVSAIDNMVKGAAGQAIQNMNIACGFAEDAGLRLIPPAF